jgi:antitoxin component of RelBE/YafQ-DinJ toxin-antitoxin module
VSTLCVNEYDLSPYKIEPQIKQKAQKIASELGLSLSAVTKALLKQFIRTKHLSIGGNAPPEIPNARTLAALKESEEDYQAGRVVSFASGKEALDYLAREIADEKRTAQ